MKKLLSILLLIFSITAYAQDKNAVAEDDAEVINMGVEMADAFRADGKIYVVVAVVLVILAGLLTYIVLLDRKISKLEKEIKSES